MDTFKGYHCLRSQLTVTQQPRLNHIVDSLEEAWEEGLIFGVPLAKSKWWGEGWKDGMEREKETISPKLKKTCLAQGGAVVIEVSSSYIHIYIYTRNMFFFKYIFIYIYNTAPWKMTCHWDSYRRLCYWHWKLQLEAQVFYDFTCLYQFPRTNRETGFFKKSMAGLVEFLRPGLSLACFWGGCVFPTKRVNYQSRRFSSRQVFSESELLVNGINKGNFFGGWLVCDQNKKWGILNRCNVETAGQ